MIIFSDKNVKVAEDDTIPAIVTLLNIAYRGESSRKGWTTEADLIAGEVRTDFNNVLETKRIPGSLFLTYNDDNGRIIGCVNLQKQESRIYLGMFSVLPDLQGGGIGKKLLQAADEYALSVGCHSIYMSVISVRSELINWYMRHGYADTGVRKAFHEDGLSGKHLQLLEFMTLEKKLTG
jgi:ribosomal protein S18 acetylase RimI-like enzyme